jgi:hypothetical protein
VSSPTTQGSGRVMSSTTISSISPAASMHKHPPYEYPILTPNTTSPSSHQSRLVSFLSLFPTPSVPPNLFWMVRPPSLQSVYMYQ